MNSELDIVSSRGKAMRETKETGTPLVAVQRYAAVLAVLWTVSIGLVLAWNLVRVSKGTREMAHSHAMSGFEKDVLYRRWSAGHGGVYAPVTEDTPPNPDLAHLPERDISTPSGRALTLINPAYMTRQVHELGAAEYGLLGHITSLNPIRPGNAPDEWETEALKAFETGAKEVSSMEDLDGSPYFRLMRPLKTEKGCLKCHAQQGYKEGDIRGGISVAVPMLPLFALSQATMLSSFTGHSVLWLVGLIGILLTTKRLRHRMGEREQLIVELQEAKDRIETLHGIVPICARCKKVRDDQGYWDEVEGYVGKHSEAEFSHSLCPECFDKEIANLDETLGPPDSP